MTIIYRLCGIPSTNPSPIYQEDKKKLNELCLKSFVTAFTDVRPYMYFLLDYCDASYVDMLEKIVPFEFDFEMTNLGINGTALKAYDLAEEIGDDATLFQECDYVWRPSAGKLLEGAIKNFGLVSPYDHLNFYIDRSIHSKTCEIDLFENQHYRTTERNTMTFGLTKEVFNKQKDILRKYGYLDNDVWHEMRANGNPLWVPIPSFATHMVKDYLSPVIPWSLLFDIYK